MSRFLWMLGCFIAVVCIIVSLTAPSPVRAQERPRVELVSIQRGESIARIRVNEGARLHDMNDLARRHAMAPGLHIDMDMIAARNPNGIIYVCFDNLRGERPMMRRDPALAGLCTGYRSAQWLVAGRTYNVPLLPEAVHTEAVQTVIVPVPAQPVAQPVIVTRVVGNLADRARIIELETQLANSRNEFADVNARERTSRLMEARRGSNTPLWLAIIFFIIVAGSLLYYRRHKDWSQKIMWRVNGMYRTWAVSRDRMRKHIIKSELEAVMHKEGMIGASKELLRANTRFGRLRKRSFLLLVQLAKYRKLLHQSHLLLNNFQRQQSEDIARRERLPKLLSLVDQAQLHKISIQKARARSAMVLDWIKRLRGGDIAYSKLMQSIAIQVYRLMLADYRNDRLQHEAQAQSCIDAKPQAIDDLYALTGMRTDSVDPEGRLQQTIQVMEIQTGIVQAKTEALEGLIQVQMTFNESFNAREKGIEVREKQIAEAEAELVERCKAQERAESIDVWTKGLAKTDKLTEVEHRMSELEGRTAGLEHRAITAEQELNQVNDFVSKLRPQYRLAKELLDEIKKGPNFLEARVIQMAEYIRGLEDKLGIERKSIWGGLPEVAYGSIPPKGNA